VSPLTYRDWELKDTIVYGPGDGVVVMTRVVLTDTAGDHWGRLLLWDSQPCSPAAAELLACPVVEALDGRYGGGNVAGVEVWQCRTSEQHVVLAPAARSQRPNVMALVHQM
jgi:hypothetical protein